jgi:hypothetical protein
MKILRQRRLPTGRQARPPLEGILLRRKNSKVKVQDFNLWTSDVQWTSDVHKMAGQNYNLKLKIRNSKLFIILDSLFI